MTNAPLLSLSDFPLCVGVCPTPSNPAPLPDVYPIELRLNESLGRLELRTDQQFESLLQTAYGFGLEMGTPSDDTELGQPYVLDFLRFIEEATTAHRGAALEIGAGVGYLSALLRERRWRVDSIEPGSGYQRHWEKYGVDVINDFFPSPQATGPYDLILAYTVLEHIQDTQAFLRNAAKHLAVGGKLILSVPDCTEEIEAGDPSMLLHEHFHYFTVSSLRRTLAEAGFDADVTKSSFGRSIYCSASLAKNECEDSPSEDELKSLAEYATKVSRLQDRFRHVYKQSLEYGTVGLYCPVRSLALLPHEPNIRFFDDAPRLRGQYYPPFNIPVEDRNDLLARPTDTLLIMSRTFGSRLAAELRPHLPATRFLSASDGFADPHD